MKLYRIRDWGGIYETHETKKYVALKWVPLPNKHDGLTFRQIGTEKRATDLFSAWILMVQIASKADRDHRGQLIRNGRPMTPRDMSLVTGFPETIFSAALEYFTQEHVGWMDAEEYNMELPLLPGVAGEPAAGTVSSPENSPLYGTDQHRKNRIYTDGKIDGGVVEEIYSAYPRKKNPLAARKAIESAVKKQGKAPAYLLERTKAFAAAMSLWPEADRQFIPYPASWFNAGGYEDDPETWKRKSSPSSPKPARTNFPTDDYTLPTGT